MWKRLRHALEELWRRSHQGARERRTAEARARFWADVRAGQREAESDSR